MVKSDNDVLPASLRSDVKKKEREEAVSMLRKEREEEMAALRKKDNSQTKAMREKLWGNKPSGTTKLGAVPSPPKLKTTAVNTEKKMTEKPLTIESRKKNENPSPPKNGYLVATLRQSLIKKEQEQSRNVPISMDEFQQMQRSYAKGNKEKKEERKKRSAIPFTPQNSLIVDTASESSEKKEQEKSNNFPISAVKHSPPKLKTTEVNTKTKITEKAPTIESKKKNEIPSPKNNSLVATLRESLIKKEQEQSRNVPTSMEEFQQMQRVEKKKEVKKMSVIPFTPQNSSILETMSESSEKKEQEKSNNSPISEITVSPPKLQTAVVNTKKEIIEKAPTIETKEKNENPSPPKNNSFVPTLSENLIKKEQEQPRNVPTSMEGFQQMQRAYEKGKKEKKKEEKKRSAIPFTPQNSFIADTVSEASEKKEQEKSNNFPLSMANIFDAVANPKTIITGKTPNIETKEKVELPSTPQNKSIVTTMRESLIKKEQEQAKNFPISMEGFQQMQRADAKGDKDKKEEAKTTMNTFRGVKTSNNGVIKYSEISHEFDPNQIMPVIDYKTVAYCAFVFVIHEQHGILLLHCTKKKKKGAHYQLPGGHVDNKEFLSAALYCGGDPLLELLIASKIGAARELYEETGIDVRNDLDRLIPTKLRGENNATSTKNMLACEIRHRVFFILQASSNDFFSKTNLNIPQDKSSSFRLKAPICKHAQSLLLKLSEEHSEFTFEVHHNVASELLNQHSGGVCKEASVTLMRQKGDMTWREFTEKMKGEQFFEPMIMEYTSAKERAMQKELLAKPTGGINLLSCLFPWCK